ncbi:MAG: aldolase/citrate lyase family protein [Saprospiraceae bacterium]|nr:aldolase/citrate lyase family protein [Saprospiraceae bacterium]MDW8483259.1 aldolase/citrate lyase family protein [Saprospiraceae bacterium]
MRENLLKKRLLHREPCYGVISPTTDPIVCEYVGLSGFHFYVIDAEHGFPNPSEVQHMVRALEGIGCTPLARVGDLNEKLILQYLDSGVLGIVMPGCSSADEVRRLVAAVKYPPLGKRGLGPVRAAEYMMKMPQAEYVRFANEQTLVLPQIEDLQAVENLDRMLEVEGVDGFVVGPRDLALAMGFYDGPAHPQVQQLMSEVFDKIQAAGKIAGTVAATAEQAQKLIQRGVHFILNSVQGLIAAGARAFLNS